MRPGAHSLAYLWQRCKMSGRQFTLGALSRSIGERKQSKAIAYCVPTGQECLLGLRGLRSLNAEALAAIEQVPIALFAGVQRLHIVFIEFDGDTLHDLLKGQHHT